jgi:hypothetical protein
VTIIYDALIGFRGLMLQRGPRIVTHFEGHGKRRTSGR